MREFIQPSYTDQVDIMVELNKIDQDEIYRNSIIDKCKCIKSKLAIQSTEKLSDIAERILNST